MSRKLMLVAFIASVAVLSAVLYILYNPTPLIHNEPSNMKQPIDSGRQGAVGQQQNQDSTMTIKTPAFFDYSSIPKKYTCDGENVNPPLTIENTPVDAKSFAFIVDDPDASNGTWTHWLVYNIAPTVDFMGEGSVPQNSVQLANDFGDASYGGPCPPKGASHRYFFKLYALNRMLDKEAISSKDELMNSIEDSVLSSAQLVGFYTH